MKKSADVVIIGGGIIGCAVAYYLSKQIKGVVLLERKGIASEASGANYGMVWQQTRQAGFNLAMAKRSLELYPKLICEVFDIDIEYERKGGMIVFFTEMQKEIAEKFVRSKRCLGIPVQLLNGTEAREIEPALSEKIIGSTYCPEEAQLNPLLTTLAFAKAAKKQGASIYTGIEVRSIKLYDESVESVITNRGEIKTRIVVNAAGAWASQIGEMVGLKVPIYPRRLQSMVTEQMPRLVNRIIQGARDVSSPKEAEKIFQYSFDTTGGRPNINQKPPQENIEDTLIAYVKPTMSDNIVLGTSCEFVGYDRGTTYDALGLIAEIAREIIPQLKDIHIIRSWANFDPYTVDGLPIVGKTKVKGFIMAAGHGTGVSHAPATGEALAALIVDGKSTTPLSKASLTRFMN